VHQFIKFADGAAKNQMQDDELRRLRAKSGKRYRVVSMAMYEEYIVEATSLVKAWLHGTINRDELRSCKIAVNARVRNTTLAEYGSPDSMTIQSAGHLRDRFRRASEQLAFCYSAAGMLLHEPVGGDDAQLVRQRAFNIEVERVELAQLRFPHPDSGT
jgi:hypothetical protein